MKNHKKIDWVNHPPHYTAGKFEVIEVLEDWKLDKDAYLFNVIAYIARSPHKNSMLQDLQKARWYLDRKIMRLEKEMGICQVNEESGRSQRKKDIKIIH